jgi:hypothetical protein
MEIQPKDDRQRVWLEMSAGSDQHGGLGWELGTCIWSPSTFHWGGYKMMYLPKCGDRVVHCYNGVITGDSRVSKECYETRGIPPSPGKWQGKSPFLRVDLSNFSKFPIQITLKEFLQIHGERIREEMQQGKRERYPFCIYPQIGNTPSRLSPTQGRLISSLSNLLIQLIDNSVGCNMDSPGIGNATVTSET